MNYHIEVDSLTHNKIREEIKEIEKMGDEMTPRDAARLSELKIASRRIRSAKEASATW